MFGASLFYGDGMITPAISVLSAVEGLEVVTPSLHSVVVPITLAVLTVLFLVQRFGTGVVGRAFGPVMAVWFTILGVAGLREVVRHPGILRALSPSYGAQFLFDHGGTAFIALGSVVLTVTGAEALYADMGHFGRPPIRRAWFARGLPRADPQLHGPGRADPALAGGDRQSVLPAAAALGATADGVPGDRGHRDRLAGGDLRRVLGHPPGGTARLPAAAEHPPHLPPRGRQVYVPAVNWGIYVAVVALVVGFGSSQHLATAYGIAVTGTLAIDTILFFFVVRVLWHKPLPVVIGGAAAFLLVDLTFFAANLTKVLHGGWFPLTIAAVVFTVLTTWQTGPRDRHRQPHARGGPAAAPSWTRSTGSSRRCTASPGTAVFLNANKETTPLALRANVEHNHVAARTAS